jgi:hypothetical protein
MPKKRSQKSRKGKRGGGGKSGGVPSSSDLSTSAARGRYVPRLNLGADTLLGLAQSQRRTLCYAEVLQTLTASATYAFQPWILNGAFAVHGGGSVPAGFVKYMAFYQKAYVLGARIVVKLINSTPTVNGVVGVAVTTNATSLAGSQFAIDNGMVQWDTIGANPDHRVFTESVDVAKFFNKRVVLDDPTLYSTNAANPSQIIVAHVFAESSGTMTIRLSTEMYLDVVFTYPIPFV